MVKLKKKYSSGEATWYMTRTQAINKLQITLRDFRRLCIVKGIYPRDPVKRRRAQRGVGGYKTLYYKKDIQFLLHEPLIWKMWESKAMHKKLHKCRDKGDTEGYERLKDQRRALSLDHIIKERYPTFSDALNDLDDAMTLCSTFAILPTVMNIPYSLVCDSRRVTVEFMHYVIESRSLRKAFISIKGFYFQADIQGHSVTWVMPHQFVYTRPRDCDMKIMTIFCDLYVTLLGFVNFRLFQSLNIVYPPALAISNENSDECVGADDLLDERVAALNCPLTHSQGARTHTEEPEDPEADLEVLALASGTDVAKLRHTRELVNRKKVLFDGFKFFISREVPREPCILVIRSLGGTCSWDPMTAPGSSYDESDQSITHQLVDRPAVQGQRHTNRYYIQPQWIFDSINAGCLRPVQLYFPGVELPPHLSPFKDERLTWGEYVPPEKIELMNELGISRDNVQKQISAPVDTGVKTVDKQSKKKRVSKSRIEMGVRRGALEQAESKQQQTEMASEQLWLRAKLMKSKDRYKYNKLVHKKKLIEREARQLREKRAAIEEQKRNTEKAVISAN